MIKTQNWIKWERKNTYTEWDVKSKGSKLSKIVLFWKVNKVYFKSEQNIIVQYWAQYWGMCKPEKRRKKAKTTIFRIIHSISFLVLSMGCSSPLLTSSKWHCQIFTSFCKFVILFHLGIRTYIDRVPHFHLQLKGYFSSSMQIWTLLISPTTSFQ